VLTEGDWNKYYRNTLAKHDVKAKHIQSKLSVVQLMLETDEKVTAYRPLNIKDQDSSKIFYDCR
jgi:hypothetical protein